MKLVIDIPKEKCEAIKDKYDTFPAEWKKWGLEAIRNGKELEVVEEGEKTGWISVRIRLPEINQKVLLCSNKGEVFVGVRDEPYKIWLVADEHGKEEWAYSHKEGFDSTPTGYDIGFIRDGECVLAITSINYNPKFSGVVAWKELPEPYRESEARQ